MNKNPLLISLYIIPHNGCKQEQQQKPPSSAGFKSRYQKHEKLEKEIKAEFPGDEMMFELHFLRALKYLAGKTEKW